MSPYSKKSSALLKILSTGVTGSYCISVTCFSKFSDDSVKINP